MPARVLKIYFGCSGKRGDVINSLHDGNFAGEIRESNFLLSRLLPLVARIARYAAWRFLAYYFRFL